MKKILLLIIVALPLLAFAQGTKVDSVTVLSDAQISAGTYADSVRLYFIQGGTWKKGRLDSLATYMQGKIGGGGGGISDGDKGDITVSSSGTVWTIDNSAVTGAKIASGAVDSTKLAAGAVVLDGAKVTGTLPGTKLAAGAVDSTKLAAGAVVLDGAKVTGSLPGTKLATGAVDSTKLAAGAVVLSGAKVTGTLPVNKGGTGETSYTNGQLLIGNTTGNTLTKATLTAGSGISITNGAGSITIATTGGGGGSGVISGVVAGEVGYGIGADSLGGESELFYDATNNRLSVGGETSPTATMQVKGAGTTTGVSLLVENSAGADRFSITDDGEIDLYNTAVTNNQTNGTAYINNMTTNGSIVIATNGTGAFMLDLPNSQPSGGNTRGNNAVDLQTVRSTAARVASGTNSVITGGNSNTASSTATFIGSGELNTASGGYSSVVAGYGNTASGQVSFVGGGEANTATTEYSAILGGYLNSASTTSNYSAIGGGRNNTAQANYVSIPGGFRSFGYLYGQNALGSGQFAAQGDAQSSTIRLRRSITGTGADTLTLDGTAYSAAATGRAILNISSPTGTNGRLWNATIQVVAIVQTLGNGTADSVAVGRSFIGNYAVGIKRIGNNTSLVGAVQNLHAPQADAGMGGCVVTIDADDTFEALRVQFTPPSGAGSTTVIRVVATVYLTEVGY